MAVEGIGRLGATWPAERSPESPERARPRPGGLRSVLTAEEAAYFARLEQLGPLTYGPKAGGAADAPAPKLGQRVDVRA
jgi:hypothetical protein